MKHRPSILIDPGLRLDDRTAGHLVDRMLDALEFDQKAGYAMLDTTKQNAWLGNPKSQQRFVKRFVKVMNRCLLFEPDVTYGSSKRFQMIFNLFDVSSGEDGPRNLSAIQAVFSSKGTRHRVQCVTYPVMFFTRHALVRLVQRTGCRNEFDLLRVLVGSMDLTCRAAISAGAGTCEHLPPDDKPGWMIPAFNASHSTVHYLVLRRGDRGGIKAPTVVTVLDGDMIDEAAMQPLFDMLNKDPEMGDHSDWPAWRAAFNATANATKWRPANA
jgi:hypothetical protein